MTEAVPAALAIWSTMPVDQLADFHDWHNTEHIPERMALPGFLGVRRYRALGELAAIFTLYDLANLDAVASAAYRATLTQPTEWTRRLIAAQLDGARALGHHRFAHTRALGSEIALWCLASDHDCADARFDALCSDVLPAIAERTDVAAVTLLVTDDARTVSAATGVAALGGFTTPRAVLIVEGWSGADRLRRAADTLAAAAKLDTPARYYRLDTIVGRAAG